MQKGRCKDNQNDKWFEYITILDPNGNYVNKGCVSDLPATKGAKQNLFQTCNNKMILWCKESTLPAEYMFFVLSN